MNKRRYRLGYVEVGMGLGWGGLVRAKLVFMHSQHQSFSIVYVLSIMWQPPPYIKATLQFQIYNNA